MGWITPPIRVLLMALALAVAASACAGGSTGESTVPSATPDAESDGGGTQTDDATGDPPPVTSSGSWSLTVDYVTTAFHDGEAFEKESGSAQLTLVEDDFQPTADKTRLTVTGGTATVDFSYSGPLCEQSGDTLSWDVSADAASGSLFAIDHSTDPETITASVSITGPEFTGEIACRGGSGDDASGELGEPEPTSFSTNVLFLSIAGEDAQPMDQSGTSASGTATRGAQSDFGSVTEMAFTLTKSG